MTVPPGPRAIQALQLRLTPMTLSDVGITMGIAKATASLHINRALYILRKNPKHPHYNLVQRYDDTDWDDIKSRLVRPEMSIEQASKIIDKLKADLKIERRRVADLKAFADRKQRSLDQETARRRGIQMELDSLWQRYIMISRSHPLAMNLQPADIFKLIEASLSEVQS